MYYYKGFMGLVVWLVYIYVAVEIALSGESRPFDSFGDFVCYIFIMALVFIPFGGALVGLHGNSLFGNQKNNTKSK